MSSANRHKPVIGLMGGVGSGKSLVARQLASLGCAVIDSDALGRAALEEADIRAELVQRWGRQILDEGGQVDRTKMARMVFEQPDRLRELEQLIHPRVHAERERLREAYEADGAVKAIVEDCPLLVEAGLDGQCDATIFVAADRQRRLERVAAERGWGEAELADREKQQVGLDKKTDLADYVVDNNAGEEDCLSQVRRVLSQILHTR